MYSRAGQTLLVLAAATKITEVGDCAAWTATLRDIGDLTATAPATGTHCPTVHDALDWDENALAWMIGGGVYRHQDHRGGPSHDPRPVRSLDLMQRIHALLGRLVPPSPEVTALTETLTKMLATAPQDTRIDPSGFFDYCEECRDWMTVVR